MSDKLGLHRISNPDPDDFAISLHRTSPELETLYRKLTDKVYTPPNAAIHGFCIYDEKTGKAIHIKQTNYYSRRGQRLDDGQ